MPIGDELTHHDLTIDQVFRAAETYKSYFQKSFTFLVGCISRIAASE